MSHRLKHFVAMRLASVFFVLASIGCAPADKPPSTNSAPPPQSLPAPSRPTASAPTVPVVASLPVPFPLPYVSGDCPGEGCEFGDWLACKDLSVRAAPADTSPVTFTIHKGEHLTSSAGQVSVDRPGIILVDESLGLETDGTDSVRVVPGDTIYVLDYVGEGFNHIMLHGEIREVQLPDARQQRSIRSLQTVHSVWWVYVNTKAGSGWSVIADNSMVGIAPHYEQYPLRCPSQ